MSCTTIKKVTFNDNVLVIGISEPQIDHEKEKEILSHFMKQQTIHNNPKKLFTESSKPAEPGTEPAFLNGLQSLLVKRKNPEVLNETKNAPSKSDPEEPSSEEYTKDEKTGAWVSKSQKETKEKIASVNQKWQEQEGSEAASTKPAFLPGYTKQKDLHSLMSMKIGDIVSNKEGDRSNSKEETVKKYVKDEKTGAWVINPKWQQDNSNQESDETTASPPAYLQNLLAEKRQVTNVRMAAINKKWEENHSETVITESTKL